MRRKLLAISLVLVFIISGFASASAATTPAETRLVSNAVSAFVRRLCSINNPARTSVSSRSMMKFEDGYRVETVFDGSKLGIVPYSVQVSPSGEILILDSENSNLYKISIPITRYSRPQLVAGSPEGYAGHVDGRATEARMNRPKGLAVDHRGNIYIADTMNMAIRKLSHSGVTTIAGGKWGRGGCMDGPSEYAKLSNDFDVVYIGSSCSLLVIDRGNRALREIQLQANDCSDDFDVNFHLGIAMLIGAGLVGYMLALLQSKARAIFSSHHNPRIAMKTAMPADPNKKPCEPAQHPLNRKIDKPDIPENGLFGSIGRLFVSTVSAAAKLIWGLFFGTKKRPVCHHTQQQYYQPVNHSNMWPIQEIFGSPHKGRWSPIQTRPRTPQMFHPYVTRDPDSFRRSYPYMQQPQQYHNKNHSLTAETCYEQSREAGETVFGPVQEDEGWRQRQTDVLKADDYADPKNKHSKVRLR